MLLRLFKRKKKNKYPRKRRIWDHEAEPLLDELKAKHTVRAYELKFATIKHHPQVPEKFHGCPVEILFYGRVQCEVAFMSDDAEVQGAKYIPTELLRFSATPPLREKMEVGEYLRLKQEIIADDELKGVLGEEKQVCLLMKITEGDEFPYWVHNPKEKTSFRLRSEEFERTNKRLKVDIWL